MVNPIGPMKRLVKADLRITEPTQMEASFQYRLMVKGENDDVIYPHRYQIESYFIFPQQMKISPSTYPLEFFYRDVKSYLNFRIPKLTFKEIMGYVETPERSPLLKIRKVLAEGEQAHGANRRKFLEQEAKIFACSFHTFITRKSKKITSSLAAFDDSDAWSDKARSVLERSFLKINVIFLEWQTVLSEAERALPEMKAELRKVDEYLVCNIHDFLLRTQKRLDGTHASFVKDFRFLIRTRLRALRIYSRREGYAWVDDSSDELSLESYLHHRGQLKRSVWSALYLDTRTKPLFALQRQMGAMVAAGIAGAWAALANIFVGLGGSGLGAQSLSFSTFILITTLTFAYILKDRIKEIGRGYFKGSLFRDLPDSSSKVIYDASGDQSGPLEVGVHEEKVAYMEIEKLPREVQSMIQRVAPERMDAEHQAIICYRKRLNLGGETFRILKRKIRAIYTFFRLNVSSFLAPLDFPFEEIPLATGRMHATARQVAKVYHIDLLLRMTAFVGGEKKCSLDYYRLIVTKAGIKRIEKLSPDEAQPREDNDD